MHPANRVSTLLMVAVAVGLTGVADQQASAQGILDRSGKNAVRGMTGEFDGLGMVVWVTRDAARRLLPQASLQLDYPGHGDLHPVVLLLGAEHNVGVQFGRSFIHPRFLREYENAYVIVPYLRHATTNQHVYIFSKIFVSDEKVTKRGSKLNGSPKVHAAIQDAADRFVVYHEGVRRFDLSMQDDPSTANPLAIVAPARSSRPPLDTADSLRTIFRQPKIEFSPDVHLFAFDFMAQATGLTRTIVSGTVRVPAQANDPSSGSSVGGGSSDVLLLAPNYPVEAVRFSSHWVKQRQW